MLTLVSEELIEFPTDFLINSDDDDGSAELSFIKTEFLNQFFFFAVNVFSFSIIFHY